MPTIPTQHVWAGELQMPMSAAMETASIAAIFPAIIFLSIRHASIHLLAILVSVWPFCGAAGART